MPTREQDDLPYRSPVTIHQPAQKSTVNEQKYDTLKIVQKYLADGVNGLYKDFNAFDISKNDLPADRAKKILHEVQVKQAAFDILTPILDAVNSAIEKIDQKNNIRNA